MLNVLFETFTDSQLQYKCENGLTVFQKMILVIRLALNNSEKQTDNAVKAMT